MANDIASQVQKNIDLVERSALALCSLSSLCMTTDHGKLDDFRFLLDYLAENLLNHVQDHGMIFKREAMPYLADVKGLRLA